MFLELLKTIESITDFTSIAQERKLTLQPLIDFIQQKVDLKQEVNLNFICTHNSRRSHLSQIWAQVAASYYSIANVYCYSGGTEETALFPKVAETLTEQGFTIFKIADGNNPIYGNAVVLEYCKWYPERIGYEHGFDCSAGTE